MAPPASVAASCSAGVSAGRGLKGEQRGDGDADECVQRVPDEIEGGNFVDEEIDAEENESGGDDAPVGQEMQRRGQVEISVWAERPSVATVA